jgi:P4 family phage/plasmid primase-like protien
MFLSGSTVFQNAKNTKYIPVEIKKQEDLKEVFSHDWCPALFNGNTRSNKNFLESSFLFGDVDGDQCVFSIEDFEDLFDEYDYIIGTSRNHQKQKGDKPPCDRFRFLLPLAEKVTDVTLYSEYIEGFHTVYPFCDPNAKDPARFFFGVENPTIKIHSTGKKFIPIRGEIKKTRKTEQDIKEDPFIDPLLGMGGELKNDNRLMELLQQAASRGMFDNRNEWLKLGFALKDAGFSVDDFIALSRRDGALMTAEQGCREVWTQSGKATKGSLVFFAQQIDPSYMEKKQETRHENISNGAHALFSDYENARLLEKNYYKELRYVFNGDLWRFFNGKIWENDESRGSKQVMSIMQANVSVINSMIEEIQGEKGSKTEIRSYISTIQKLLSQHGKSCCESMARDMMKISLDVFNSKHNFFPCENGVVNLENGEIYQHNSDNYFTFYSKIKYNPMAKCDTFKAWLSDIFLGNKSIIDFMQVFLGYCLTGETSSNFFPIFYGKGRNGKSTLLNIMRGIMGDFSYRSTGIGTIMEKKNENDSHYELSALEGARLVVAGEPKKNQSFDVGIIKTITGGDGISCRQLYGEFRTYIPTWKIVVMSNNRPTVSAQDEGIWRRIKLIPFDYTIEAGNEKKNYHEILLENEGEGILAWCIEGAKKWYASGFPRCKEIEAITEDYRSEENTINEFIEECVIIYKTSDREYLYSDVKFSEMLDRYNKWADDNSAFPMKRKTFGKEMEAIGLEKKHRANGNYFLHCKLKDGSLNTKDLDDEAPF